MAMCIRCEGGALGGLGLCLDCINDDADAAREAEDAALLALEDATEFYPEEDHADWHYFDG